VSSTIKATTGYNWLVATTNNLSTKTQDNNKSEDIQGSAGSGHYDDAAIPPVRAARRFIFNHTSGTARICHPNKQIKYTVNICSGVRRRPPQRKPSATPPTISYYGFTHHEEELASDALFRVHCPFKVAEHAAYEQLDFKESQLLSDAATTAAKKHRGGNVNVSMRLSTTIVTKSNTINHHKFKRVN